MIQISQEDIMSVNFTVYKSECKMAEVKNGKVRFFNKILENRMNLLGVRIPASVQERFNKEPYITCGNPLFTKAFLEIYFPDYLKRQGCRLEVSDKTNRIIQDKRKNGSAIF